MRELPGGWGYLELDLDALFERVVDLPVYEDVITYPALKQDLAFVVDERVRAGELVAAAREAAGAPSCARCGPSTSTAATRPCPGKKSIAFAVSFQSPERTLSDEEAARAPGAGSSRRSRSEFGAVLRA